MQVAIVIPIYNEASVLAQVIQGIKNQGYPTIIVIDDGSSDASHKIAQHMGVISLQHQINRGKGAALQTGMAAARQLEADIIVTMDGDGQHDPADIPKLVAPIEAGSCDVALGTRLHDPIHMPKTRRWSNQLANVITWLLHGLWVTDSQSGFRAYSRAALQAMNPQADRYEYDSAVIREIRRHQLRWCEVPIAVRYTSYSTTKPHRQSITNALKTLRAMVWQVLS